MNQPRYDTGPERPPRLTAILVNYNGWPDVVRVVTTLSTEPEFHQGRLHVVVVDNASQGPVPEPLLRDPPPGLKLLLRPENGGFAVGVNAGWRLSRSPWLLVLNPDVEIESGLVGQVLARLDRYEQQPSGTPGIVGFGLRNPEGTPQGSVGVFPSLWRTVREQFIPRYRRKYQSGRRIRSGPVDWVTGACMLLNARMVAQLEGMDEDFFLYYEEVALCHAAQSKGWRVEFDDSVQVVHQHPLQNRPVSPKMRVITRHSKLLYFRKYLPCWQLRALSWIVTAEAASRGAMSCIRGDAEATRAWAAIGDLARQFRGGTIVKGSDMLPMAEAVESPSAVRTALRVRV
ncbi:MAG: glycosyltransferase family 2 protein [Planctomycetaceae bacterium]|nr:glycosyltransferase family 2 protein [Planctomycetaceae bacterium]